MCNSSFQMNDSISAFDQSNVMMICLCKGHFGNSVILVTLALYFIVGTPIHCWSLWVFLHGNMKPNLVIPLNITIAELFVCILCFTDFIVKSYPTVAGNNFLIFFIGLCWTVRPLLQICMSIDHYMAVIHPLTFLRYKGIQYRIASAAAAWLIATGNSVRIVFIGLEYFPDHVFFLIFYISVMIISFCCVSVLYALKRRGPGEQTNVERHNKTDRGRAVANQQKNRAFKLISHSLVFIMICYLPHGVSYFMRIAKISKHVYICSVSPLILTFSMTAILISPLVKMYYESQIKQITCFSKLKE